MFKTKQAEPEKLVELIDHYAKKRDIVKAPAWKEHIDSAVRTGIYGLGSSKDYPSVMMVAEPTVSYGIKNARADFVMFCDADDYYDESMCEEMYKAVAYSSRIDMGISEINVIYEAHREMKYSDDNYYSLKYTGIQKINDDLILNTDLSPTNKIFKKR